MRFHFKNAVGSLWSRPDPVLAGAGVAGELLVAKVRLALATVILLIPVINALFFPQNLNESRVGFGLCCGTFLLAAGVYVLLSRDYNPRWLGFASSSLDVTLVSSGLALFLYLGQPHTAVNSKVIFEGYFLVIAATSLRYDQRVCITAGLLALSQYFTIVYIGATHWDLNSKIYAPYSYGTFDWSAQISRLLFMFTASALSLALVSRSQHLLQLATSDALTGLFNRGYIDDRFAIELGRARRYDKQLSVAVIDADRFKALNDTHGHSAGDQVLRKIGEILRDSSRQSDTVGRYGGEEFVVIMPETDIASAHHKVEALRGLLASIPIDLPIDGKQVHITISAGIASYPEDGSDAADLFAVADERMFQAKSEGRNRVVAGPPLVLA